VEYGREGDIPLLLDIYRPKNVTTPRPAIVFIHGGGWVKGSRKDYTIYAQQFAEWGYVAATISYRFSDVAKFPGCVSDSKCAIRWLRANAERLGINPAQIAAAGGSGGAYLAMMLGYTSDVATFEGTGGNPGESSAIQAVVDLYGPTDFTAPVAQEHRSVVGLMGVSYAEAPERYREASPLHHLDASDPPTFIIQGTLDSVVPTDQSDVLAEKLQKLNVDYWYDCYPGWPHTMDMALSVTSRVQPTIRAFLEHAFGKPEVV
jgi:acetyl esterase/lipase